MHDLMLSLALFVLVIPSLALIVAPLFAAFAPALLMGVSLHP